METLQGKDGHITILPEKDVKITITPERDGHITILPEKCGKITILPERQRVIYELLSQDEKKDLINVRLGDYTFERGKHRLIVGCLGIACSNILGAMVYLLSYLASNNDKLSSTCGQITTGVAGGAIILYYGLNEHKSQINSDIKELKTIRKQLLHGNNQLPGMTRGEFNLRFPVKVEKQRQKSIGIWPKKRDA